MKRVCPHGLSEVSHCAPWGVGNEAEDCVIVWSLEPFLFAGGA